MLELFSELRPKLALSQQTWANVSAELLNTVLVPPHLAVFTCYLKRADPVSHPYTEQALSQCPVQVLFIAVSKDESVPEVRYAVVFP